MSRKPETANRIVHVLNVVGGFAFLMSFAANTVSAWLMVPVLVLPVVALTICVSLASTHAARQWTRSEPTFGALHWFVFTLSRRVRPVRTPAR
jgi:hypothetical protein